MAATRLDMERTVADLAKLYSGPLYTYDLETMRNIARDAIKNNELVQAITIWDRQLDRELVNIQRQEGDLAHFQSISKPIIYHHDLLGRITLYYSNPYDFFLTDREHQYLATHPVVTFVTDPFWPPIEFIGEDGTPRGMSNDILQLIGKKTGIQFKWIRTDSWSRSLFLVKEHKVELLSAIAKTAKRTGKFNFTRPYFTFPVVMVTTQDKPFINSLDDLAGQKVVVVKGYAVTRMLARRYPSLRLLRVDNVEEALQTVAREKAYTYVGILPVASFNIGKHPELNLKIAGKSRHSLSIALATYRGNSPELITILDKAIRSLSREEKQQIYDKWIQVRFEQKTDYSLAWKVLSLALFVLAVFFYWNRKLSAINRKLDEQRRIFRTIYEKSADAILLLRDGVFIDCNESALTMLGYRDREQVVGRRPVDLSPPVQPDAGDSGHAADKMVRRAMDEGCHHFQWVHVRADGTEFWTDVVYTRLVLDNKVTIHVRWLDIQRQKELQRQLVEQREKAIAASKAKSDFLANMSHEIRTPMNAVLGMLYLALKTRLTEQQRTYLHKARKAAQSLLAIINDILDLSKIEAGKMELEQVEFRLESVLEQLKDSVEILVEDKNVQFLIRQDMHLPPVLIGDPVRIGQILLNLCGNACKFTEEGEVELSLSCLECTGGPLITGSQITLQITVRDTGLGMDEKTRGKIFEKFTQADQSTTRRHGGTGLGLTISQALAHMMGGRIWIEKTAPGQGSTFCCTLRLQLPEQDDRQSSLQEKIGPLLQGVRVLVVEGNPASRNILVEIMSSCHMEVATAADGAAAISALKNTDFPIDIVFVDREMPGFDSSATAQQILDESAIMPKPKLVLTTGHGRETVFSQADQAGYDAILIKPATPSTLLDTILSVLGHNRLVVLEKENGYHDVPAQSSYRGRRFLLVEDNELNRDFSREFLESMDIEVDEAINGAEAVKMAVERRYDLILMDVHMPVLDGLEATRKIRRQGEKSGYAHLRTLPIIALTALAMTDDREKCLRAGMTDVITKPIDPGRLVSVIGKILQSDSARIIDNAAERVGSDRLWENNGNKERPILDIEKGVYRIGGSRKAYHRQLRRLRDRYDRAVEKLGKLLREEGITAGEEYCHALKGVFGNIGATKLYDCTCAVDEELKKGNMPDKELLAEMEQLLAEVLEEIDVILYRSEKNRAPAGSLDMEKLHARLIALKSLLHSDLGAADTLLEEIQTDCAGTEAEEMVVELARHMDLFAVDKAIATINTWCGQHPPAARD